MWKHIWTQNGRIFVKEAERTKPVTIDSFEDLEEFRSKYGGCVLFIIYQFGLDLQFFCSFKNK